MGRPSHARRLHAWMNGELVGAWVIPTRGEPEFVYEASWFASPAFRSLSLSLPAIATHPLIRGERVNAYFDNLLPDSAPIRKRLQTKFRTGSRDAFDLLAAIGRDCVGAIQLLPPEEAPSHLTRIEAQPLSDEEVERTLTAAVSTQDAWSADDAYDLRISIAGAQEKTALLWHQGKWCRPLGATPTTHILKLPLGLVGHRQADMRTSVENEWLCAQILAAYGIPIAQCEYRTFGQQKCLIVARFDRKLHSTGRYWLRLPQEDFCQATATPAAIKYESDGGPGMRSICEILTQSDRRLDDLNTFFKAQVLFWMLRATDGHAKNFSIALLPQDHFHLTPLYDVLSAWPIIGTRANQLPPQKIKMAMAWLGKNRHYAASTLKLRHMEETAQKLGIGANARPMVEELIKATPHAIKRVSEKLPHDFPLDIAEAIFTGLQTSANYLAAKIGTDTI